MFEAFIIWLYLGLGKFLYFAGSVGLFAGIVYVVMFAIAGLSSEFGESEDEFDRTGKALYFFLKKQRKVVVATTLTIGLLCSMYPDKDDLKWIIGGALVWNGVEAASDIEGIEELPQNTVDAMNHFLKSIETKKGGND